MKPKHPTDDPLSGFPGPLYRKVKKIIKDLSLIIFWDPNPCIRYS